MATTQQLNCACCKVCPEIANEPEPKILHARLRILSDVTPLPNIVWNDTDNSWEWAAAVPGNRIPIVGSPNTDPTVSVDVVDAFSLLCGSVVHSDPIVLPLAAANIRNSSGSLRSLASTELASLYDPGPGSFFISYNLGNTTGEGFSNFADADIELEITDIYF